MRDSIVSPFVLVTKAAAPAFAYHVSPILALASEVRRKQKLLVFAGQSSFSASDST